MATLRLPVKLMESDRLNIGADLSACVKAIEHDKAAKKLATAGFNKTIRKHEVTQHELNESLIAGVIHREVDVRDEKDYVTGKTRTIRLDTGEEVVSKDIDPDERQKVLGLPSPGSKVVGVPSDAAEEQSASSPEEAEKLREERLANERAERISAAVSEARARIVILGNGEGAQFRGVVQVGNRVIEEVGFSEAQTVAAVVATLTEHVEAEEAAREPVQTWDDVKAASAEAERQREIDRLAAEQADDQKKNGPKNLLKPPRGKKAKTIKINDGSGTDLMPKDEADPPADEAPPSDGLAF